MMQYRYVTSAELGDCPAAVDCDEGMLLVNRDVWNRYDEFERRFLIAHEEGHYYLDTDDETEADIYALRQVAGTAPKSLARSIETLLKVGVLDEGRYYRLYEEALRIDGEMGNPEAAKELRKIQKQNKKSKSMKTRRYYRADGEEPEAENTRKPNTEHLPNGVHVAGYYFSFTNILLIAIGVMLYVKLK